MKVSVNGREAPLFAVVNLNGQEQVNFQTPWETETRTAQVVVTRDGLASSPVEVGVQPVQPGIFELNGGEAIVVRAAGNSLVTPAQPLRPGELVYIYATGLGPVDANPGTGNAGPGASLARARTSPSVTIDGAECEVLFAGLAPDFVGIYQVNIRVAPAARSGQREMVLSSGGVRGKPVRVTLQ